MIRRLFYELLLFLLPFALYAIYLKLIERDAAASKRAHPWTILFASGLLLVVASFLIWGIEEGAGERGVYVPPHVEDGRVIPGRVVPQTQTPP
jgi:hypothetical protein